MDFNYEPYWDDFEASNGAREQNYMRILFRPGYSVQARELTQLQTIIQNQIKQFGNHIFRNGSPVWGGHMTLDKMAKYVKLEPTYNNIDVDVTEYLDRVVFNQSGTAKKRAKVIAVYESSSTPTLMVRTLSGTDFTATEVIGTSTGSLATVAASPTGYGTVAHINEGVFFVNGFFVYVEPQTIVLDAYSSSPTYKVGLEIDEQIVDEGADGNLLDPAQNSFNYQAPGAHRYKFGLNLAKRPLDTTDDSTFFELMRVESGNITKIITDTQYAAIEGLLARRTYDESGNYVVNEFPITLKANTSDSSKFVARIGQGRAYVGGYVYDTFSVDKLDMNKGRTYDSVTDYDLNIGYGNYIVTKDLKVRDSSGGLPDMTAWTTLDFHCANTENINYTSAATYNATYMGSATFLNMDRSGIEYITYLSDISISSNTFVTPDANASTNTVELRFPSTYSANNDAYKGIKVRFLSGVDRSTKTIKSYDGSTKRAILDSGYTGASQIPASTKVELAYDKSNIKSLISARSSKTAANLTMNVSTRSQSIGTSTANTYFSDTNKKQLIYILPDNYIKYDSITNADYYFKKYVENKEFVYNGTSCSTSLTFVDGYVPFGGVAGSTVSSVQIAEYIIVLNRSTGLIVSSDNIKVTISDSTNITITVTGPTSTFNGDIYITLKADNSEYTTKRTKTLIGDFTTKKLTSNQLPPSSGSSVSGQSSVRIDDTNGFIWFTDASIINKSINGSTSLYIPDVVRIKAIFDSQSTTDDPTLLNAVDITDRFLLDSGQRDSYYDHSAIVLKSGSAPPAGRIVVLAQWYQHSTGGGYFNGSSYNQQLYNDGVIPVYVSSSTGTRYPLRDCIDFRPSRKPKTTAFTLLGYKAHKPDLPMELSYSYYLPRIDSIVITPDRTLKVIEGNPGKKPIKPDIQNDFMELYTVQIPAFTPNVSTVKTTSGQNKRYTMSDIGKLETRIQNVEYYTSLSLAEKAAANKTILKADGSAAKDKYGMLVENFVDFKSSDVYAYDFSAAIDGGVLKPLVEMNSYDLALDAYDSSIASINEKTISLKYTEEEALSQLMATSNVSVQPYLFGTFEGILKVSPEVDTVHSFTLAPEIITDNGTKIVPKVEQEQSDKIPAIPDRTAIVKRHFTRWVNKIGKTYIPVSLSYNDETYSTTPDSTINNL